MHDSHASNWFMNAHFPLHQYSPMATLFQIRIHGRCIYKEHRSTHA